MLSSDQKRVIEREVLEVLGKSPSFHALSHEDRQRIVGSTAQVASQLVAQQMAAPAPKARRDPYAMPFEDPPFPPLPADPTQQASTPSPPPADDRWRPDERFRAEGIAAGVTQAGRMVKEVDFPAFVSSLVKGTFNAVVDASIQQMKAYGELVNSVAMSISEFRDQNVEVAEGQKHLASKYPNVFEMVQGKLQVKEDFDSESMPDFQAELGVSQPIEDLDEEGSIDALITAARTELARGRQQLLATTILMGINRIIVTDGKINAKIRFDFTASDNMTRTGDYTEWDKTQKKTQDYELGIGDKYVKGHFEQPIPLRVSTTTATSVADIQAEATLQGSVSLNFKSETFPLEKMVTSDQMFRLNQAHGAPVRSCRRRAPSPTGCRGRSP
jgi:hypothetical protein